MSRKHYSLGFSFVNGLGCSQIFETLPEVIAEIRRLDHEGASWSVGVVEDITSMVQEKMREDL